MKGRSKFCIEEQGFGQGRLLCALGLYQTLADAEVVNQSSRKRCWSTALQKLLLQSFTVDTQRVSRARSPLRAGTARTGPAYRLESCFPRSYERGYEHNGARPSTGAGP